MSISTIHKQPIAIQVTVFPILIKVTNGHFIFYIQKINWSLAKTDDVIRTEIQWNDLYWIKKTYKP